MTSIPSEIRHLIRETLDSIRAHPKHEMGQQQRRKIYQALWTTSQGDSASKWLAILAARRVQPLYEQAVAASSLAHEQFDEGPVMGLVDRMLRLAERIAAGTLALHEVKESTRRGDIEDFYHTTLVATHDEFPHYVWLATNAAYYALSETMGVRPLETTVSGQIINENGNRVYSRSNTWSDDRLAGSGCHAADASVDAAYAFAEMTSEQSCDTSKLLEFWEWWLNKGIPEAWRKAGEKQKAC
jgi:hypothetical protein